MILITNITRKIAKTISVSLREEIFLNTCIKLVHFFLFLRNNGSIIIEKSYILKEKISRE